MMMVVFTKICPLHTRHKYKHKRLLSAFYIPWINHLSRTMKWYY